MLVTQSCLTLCDPRDYSPPGSSVPGIFQVRILEWLAIPSSRGFPNPGVEPGSPVLQADSLLSELPGQRAGSDSRWFTSHPPRCNGVEGPGEGQSAWGLGMVAFQLGLAGGSGVLGRTELGPRATGGRGHGGRGRPYPQVVLLLFSLYPVEGLLLGVDAEGEAAGPGGEDAVLNRELVGGQPLGAPPGRDSNRGSGDFLGQVVN